MKTQPEEHFEFLCHLHAESIDLATCLRFDKDHPWHRNLVCLYATILELTASACILIREGVSIGVPILLRSALEASLDFANLASDRKYGYYMEAAERHEWTKMLRHAKEGNNPFLTAMAKRSEADDALNRMSRELAELKKKGYRPLGPKEKFEKANMEPIYQSMYNDLCCDSHNNIRALITRHMDVPPHHEDFAVDFCPPIDFEGILPYVDTFCGIVMSTTETLHRILKTGSEVRINELKKKSVERRKDILTEPGV